MGRDTGIATRLRAAGLRVVEVAGWQTAGSESFSPRGAVNHHTAGPSSGSTPSLSTVIYGRPDLPGPLANVFQSRESGGVDIAYVVAAGRANHAGEGGWRGLSGNSSVYGLEVEHTGLSSVPVARLETAARIIAAMFPGDPSMVCQHAEWTPRKIDFATNCPGDWFRELVADARTPSSPPIPEGPPMVLVTQTSTGNLWLIEGGGANEHGETGRRTLIPTADRDSWKKSGLPHASASDELFGNLAQGRARVQ